MSERPIPVSEEERARQRDVLTALWKASGLKLTPAAASIGISASQLSRYLSGETILPTPYYRAVAMTFGIRRADLADRLGLLEDEDEDSKDAPHFRRALRGVAPTWLLDQLAQDFADVDEAAQKAAAFDVQEMLRELREKISPKPSPSPRRDRSA